MTGPPASQSPHTDPAANRGLRIPLLADRYDVVTADGRFVCRVDRAEAEAAILAGVAEGIGRTCVKYLRISRIGTTPKLNAGSQTTQRARNDTGEFVGGPWVRKHRDARKDSDSRSSCR